jgi:tripartite ATP-independent transporter DctM subunit
MEWYYVFLILIGLLLILILSGLPVAFAFMAANFIIMYSLMGGTGSFSLAIHSAFTMLNNFMLVPIALFIIMGDILFQSGAAWRVIDSLDKWVGHIPARLSILGVVAGAVFAVLNGVPMGTTAMLGAVFVPEMRKRGYSKLMSIGPVLGGGGLAMVIPPSAMAVLLGSLADVSIGALLIACIVPGLLLTTLYIIYILYQAIAHPDLVPKYAAGKPTFNEKMTALLYIIPLAGVIFMVTGVIFLGIATPTEASATGALASFGLVALYRCFSLNALNRSIFSSVQVTIMVMIIITGSVAFCQILAVSGCTHGLARFAAGLKISPMLTVMAMQLAVVLLGLFMDLISITMITVPIFMPVVNALGIDPLWFCTMMLFNLCAATLTPPFGMLLFTMKGVATPDISMGDIIRASLPFFLMDIVLIALVFLFPSIALWLPARMK